MRLGWRFHRIWSTDWFHRREPEIERALAAYEDAVARNDLIASGDPQRPSVTNDTSQSRKLQSSNSPERTATPTLGRRDNITEYSRRFGSAPRTGPKARIVPDTETASRRGGLSLRNRRIPLTRARA